MYISILVFLILPLLQTFTPVFPFDQLKGDFETAKDTVLTIDTWFSKEYQKKKETYLSENFGLRSYFVRCHNQLQYSLYGNIFAKDIYEGTDGYFFRFYLDAFTPSSNYRGDEQIKSSSEKFKICQERLQEKGKLLVFVFAPAKFRYYDEFLPTQFKDTTEEKNNYSAYKKAFEKERINYIDFNEWFLKMKDTTSVTLIAKGGIHWTQMGSILAMDSLSKYIENHTGVDYPNLIWAKPEARWRNWGPDRDIVETMNLFYVGNELNLHYPSSYQTTGSSRISPSVLMVADSYYDAPAWSDLPKLLFANNSQYWYYNRECYDVNKNLTMVNELNFGKEIESHDVIFVMCSEINLENFSWGFIDQLYEYIHKEVN